MLFSSVLLTHSDIIHEPTQSTTDVYEGCDTYYDYATRNLRDPSLPCNEIDADDVKEVDPEIIDVSEQYQHKWDMEKIQMKYQDRESTGESVQFYVPLEGNTERHLQVLPRYGMLDDRVSDFCGMDSLALQEIEFELCKSQVSHGFHSIQRKNSLRTSNDIFILAPICAED